MPMQFRPLVPPPPPPPPFIPVAPQQFQPVGHSNMAMTPHPPPIQYPQTAPPPPLQPPPLQRPPLPQSNRPVMSSLAQPQIPNNFMPAFSGPRIPHIPFSLSSSSGGQTQISVVSAAQHLPMSQTDAPNFSAVGPPWFHSGTHNTQSSLPVQPSVKQSSGDSQTWFSSQSMKPVTPLQQNSEQNGVGKNNLPDLAKMASTDWREHTSREGKKYYYNKKTKVSSWEKPFELMTPIERADATTDWREFTTPEGRKFYFNKVMKISKWAIPEEVQLARHRANMNPCEGTPTDVTSYASAAVSASGQKASTPDANNLSSSLQEIVPSPISVTPGVDPELPAASGTSSIHEAANLKSDITGLHSPLEISTAMVAVLETSPMRISNVSPQEATPSFVKTSTGSVDEANRSAEVFQSGDSNAPEGKKLELGPLVYESKEEAKSAFKALLETANVGSDWNWDQAMRLIINDRRYGALKTLGERRQAFNEFVGQKKKQEADERRARQKKAKEDFKTMLNESKDLTSSTRWSKAVSMFESDERFHAIERVKDREDLFDDHLEELKKKERAKALEENKRHKAEYLEFLKSCDYVKASSQWRKVQDRLEDDERCLRLEKIDRLEIFQEYVRDLEKEEEELRKLRMEELRKAERKNRDEFRKLMEEHVSNGILTANSQWRDYIMKVKDAPAYLAVTSNTTGSKPKDLFDDVIDDLEKQYSEDRENIEAAMKTGKISLSTTWTFEDFKTALSKEIKSKSISDINLKLVFDDLLRIAKEKEEKEAKKQKRLTEDVYQFLVNSKEITSSSKWEEFKPHLEKRYIAEESFFQEIFNKVIFELKEKAKEKERKRKEEKAKRERERKEKEKKKDRRYKDRGVENRKSKERRRVDDTDSDGSGSYSVEDNRRSRDRRNKHHKRSSSFDDDEKDRSRSRRRSVDPIKSKQSEKQTRISEEDLETQNKRQKRDHSDGSNKKVDSEEQNRLELDEDAEVVV